MCGRHLRPLFLEGLLRWTGQSLVSVTLNASQVDCTSRVAPPPSSERRPWMAGERRPLPAWEPWAAGDRCWVWVAVWEPALPRSAVPLSLHI